MQVLHHLVPKCKTSLKDRMQMQDKDVELLPYNLVSLNEASINVHNWIDGKQECGQCLGKLLCGLNKVKSLKLSNEALEGFKPEDKGMIIDIVPACFWSCLKSVLIFNAGGVAAGLCFLKYLFGNAPVLERLSVGCTLELSKDLDKQEEIRNQLQQLRGGSGGSCIVV
ncbi:uncharacterized protein LOC111297013 isoform X1 [Durio zibethinus]|uniref:Uncharacterized protein LOC111297013 isoform X1 n=1 Tax=Durio zibethinus TaxID=66656 RepID=A0A6P5Z3I9_DURZI|nr:uncharacterized protein LOC111297013 isoform X1 [Durio zibethinus]